MTVSSTWLREQGEDDAEFDFEYALRDPNKSEQLLVRSFFQFTKAFQRLDVLLPHPPFAMIQGIHILESRVRRRGSVDAWKTQEYPFQVEILYQDATKT
jgi:hypothetical protein